MEPQAPRWLSERADQNGAKDIPNIHIPDSIHTIGIATTIHPGSRYFATFRRVGPDHAGTPSPWEPASNWLRGRCYQRIRSTMLPRRRMKPYWTGGLAGVSFSHRNDGRWSPLKRLGSRNRIAEMTPFPAYHTGAAAGKPIHQYVIGIASS